jgi:hypothetical protein
MSDGLNHNTKIVNNQGGNELDVLEGGELDIEGNMDIEDGGTENIKDGGVLSVKSGGTINFESGSHFQIDGEDVTASAEDINAGTGTAQTTPGVVEANKPTVPDENIDLVGFRYHGSQKYTAGGDGVAGTFELFPATANKGTTTWTMSDNTGDTLTNINVALQAGARTYTVPDAGGSASFVMTLGTYPTITVTKPSFGATPRPKADIATFAIAAGASGVSNVTLTVKDGAGVALARSTIVDVYLSDSATGDSIAAHVPDTSMTIVTNGLALATLVTNKMLRCKTKNDGTLTIAIADATKTHYYVAAVVDGDISVSAQLEDASYGA